jgi:DNA-binding MarR family transcriptional regulator
MQHVNQYRQWFAGQGKILEILADKGSMTQNELLEIMKVKAPSLSESLAKLEKQKMIKRKVDPKDGRGNIVMLTLHGKWHNEHFRKMREMYSDNIFSSLSEDEKEQLTTILEKLHMQDGAHAHVHFRGHHFRHKKGTKPPKGNV